MRRVISLFREDREDELLPLFAREGAAGEGEYFAREPEYFQLLLEYLRQRKAAVEAVEKKLAGEGTD